MKGKTALSPSSSRGEISPLHLHAWKKALLINGERSSCERIPDLKRRNRLRLFSLPFVEEVNKTPLFTSTVARATSATTSERNVRAAEKKGEG